MHVQKMMMLLLIMMLLLMMMMTIKAKHTRSFCGAHPSGANVVGGPRSRWQRARKFVACFVLFVVAAFLFYRRINMEIFH